MGISSAEDVGEKRKFGRLSVVRLPAETPLLTAIYFVEP